MESLDRGLAASLNTAVAPHPTLVALLRVVTNLGGAAVLWWLVGLGTVLLLIRRRFALAVYLLVAGAGSLILDPTLKFAVGRLRPTVADPIAFGQGNSFPSGHALGSIVCYGALLLVFLPALTQRWRKPVTYAVAVLVIVIGLSRILLGVHYLSDVAGAWFLGVAWLGLTAYAFELSRRGAGKRITQPLAEGLQPEAGHDLEPTEAVRDSRTDRILRPIAGTLVAWVLIFGVVVGVGELVTRYGGGNLFGDQTVPRFLQAHRTPSLNTISAFWSSVGGTRLIIAVTLIVGAIALGMIRRWRPVIFLVALLLGELTLFVASAGIVGRARPEVIPLETHLPTSSYPSGHVAATICVYVAVALLVIPRTKRWWRWLALIPAIMVPLLVALSRMYRGMHHPTDVLGSVILAAAWIATTYWAAQPNHDLRPAAGGLPQRLIAGPEAAPAHQPVQPVGAIK